MDTPEGKPTCLHKPLHDMESLLASHAGQSATPTCYSLMVVQRCEASLGIVGWSNTLGEAGSTPLCPPLPRRCVQWSFDLSASFCFLMGLIFPLHVQVSVGWRSALPVAKVIICMQLLLLYVMCDVDGSLGYHVQWVYSVMVSSFGSSWNVDARCVVLLSVGPVIPEMAN